MYWFFDLDGTLADTDRDIREAWKAALADLGLDCPNFERDFIAGPPIDEMTRRLFPDRFTQALSDAVREGFARHYDSDGFPNTREYAGVLDVVKALKERGDFVAIVTNKRFAGATAMARKFGWYAVFDALHTGDMDVAQNLPGAVKLRKSELLKRVIRALDAPPADCLMIGDTISDFEAAEKCGVRSVGVTWGYGKPEELADADFTIDTPAQLLSLRVCTQSPRSGACRRDGR